MQKAMLLRAAMSVASLLLEARAVNVINAVRDLRSFQFTRLRNGIFEADQEHWRLKTRGFDAMDRLQVSQGGAAGAHSKREGHVSTAGSRRHLVSLPTLGQDPLVVILEH